MNTATKSRKAVKLVTIIYAYVFKHLNRVCFVVLSDEGQKRVDSDPNHSPKQEDTYNTCFDNGKGSCTCRGNAEFHLECYHIKQLAPVAVARLAKAQAKATAERVIRNQQTAEAMLQPRTDHEIWIENEIAETTAAARSMARHEIGLGLLCAECGGTHSAYDHAWNAMSMDARQAAIDRLNDTQSAYCQYCGGNHASSNCNL